jgi:hypothetical protein
VNGLTLQPDTVEPWPFAADSVQLHTDGRRLEGRFSTVGTMRQALDTAPWVTLRFALTRRP